MKYIKEGGKIKLVIPPELGYGQRATRAFQLTQH